MRDERPVPDLWLEQLALDELPPARREALEARPDVRARLEAIRVSDQQILGQYPPGQMAERIRSRLARSEPAQGASGIPRWLLLCAPAALAALLLVVLWPSGTPDPALPAGAQHPPPARPGLGVVVSPVVLVYGNLALRQRSK